jgi:hypothetical protein
MALLNCILLCKAFLKLLQSSITWIGKQDPHLKESYSDTSAM